MFFYCPKICFQIFDSFVEIWVSVEKKELLLILVRQKIVNYAHAKIVLIKTDQILKKREKMGDLKKYHEFLNFKKNKIMKWSALVGWSWTQGLGLALFFFFLFFFFLLFFFLFLFLFFFFLFFV